VLGQVRRTQRYTPRMGGDEVLLTTTIVSLARHYGRYGYRRITAMLRADGWGVNQAGHWEAKSMGVCICPPPALNP